VISTCNVRMAMNHLPRMDVFTAIVLIDVAGVCEEEALSCEICLMGIRKTLNHTTVKPGAKNEANRTKKFSINCLTKNIYDRKWPSGRSFYTQKICIVPYFVLRFISEVKSIE